MKKKKFYEQCLLLLLSPINLEPAWLRQALPTSRSSHQRYYRTVSWETIYPSVTVSCNPVESHQNDALVADSGRIVFIVLKKNLTEQCFSVSCTDTEQRRISLILTSLHKFVRKHKSKPKLLSAILSCDWLKINRSGSNESRNNVVTRKNECSGGWQRLVCTLILCDRFYLNSSTSDDYLCSGMHGCGCDFGGRLDDFHVKNAVTSLARCSIVVRVERPTLSAEGFQ